MNGTIGEVVQLVFGQQQEIGEATRVHQGNEIVDKASCKWM
jgi:hypothetical protein